MTVRHHLRGVWREDLPARAVYSEAAGIARIVPDAVAVPADAADAAALVRWARESSTPMVPRGSGSSMAGGAIGRGVIVDLSRLDTIGTVDRESRRVAVGPGAVRNRVNDAARRHGLRFPVDPSSGAFCTVGGMAATNAAGTHSLRFGATRAWVTGLECVFDDGTIATIRRDEPLPNGVAALDRFFEVASGSLMAEALRGDSFAIAHAGVRKESSGYAIAEYAQSGSVVDLMVGSEGTLALFTAAELALAPLSPLTASVLAAFPDLDAAVLGAAVARAADASACELLDRTFLDVAAMGPSPVHIPDGTEAVLLIEIEAATDEEAERRAHGLVEQLRRASASEVLVALDADTEAALWTLRHAASPILARLDPSLRSMQFIEDAAVPPDRLGDYVRGVRASLASRGIRGVIFGHAGDAHVHVNPLIDVRRPDWRERVADVLFEVTELVASLGGTLAGEHGDGRLRTPLLDRVWPSGATRLFAQIKHAFDPEGIFNPGVKVPLEGQRPLGDIKYDSALPPLPAEVRATLDRIERTRSWSDYRLEDIGRPG